MIQSIQIDRINQHFCYAYWFDSVFMFLQNAFTYQTFSISLHWKMPTVNQPPLVTDICLGCICEAVSGCDRTLKCSDGVCGLFAITWAYWADSGKPTLRGEDKASGSGKYILIFSLKKKHSQFLPQMIVWRNAILTSPYFNRMIEIFSFRKLCEWSILRRGNHSKIHE